MAEQAEAHRRVQESLRALQALLAAQVPVANPTAGPLPETQQPAPQAQTGGPRGASPIRFQEPPPDTAPKFPDKERRTTRKKTTPVSKAGARSRPLPRKEKVCPVPGRGHPIDPQGVRPRDGQPRSAPRANGREKSLHLSASVNNNHRDRFCREDRDALSSGDDTSRVDLRDGLNARKERARKQKILPRNGDLRNDINDRRNKSIPWRIARLGSSWSKWPH